MNLKHFIALIQLRYQLSFNQIRKAGKLNLILSVLALVIGLISSVSAFFIGLLGGAVWFQDASTTTILITWNAIVAAFVGMWLIGLLVELQQTELMSIDKLLHLPISLRGAFFLNYTSSFVNTTFILFAPTMIGLSLGLTFARGWGMLLSIPLVLGFLFLVTTLTYQLRGWLARIMENKRTRGTIIAFITVFIILLSQIPNLINLSYQGSRKERRELRRAQLEEIKELGRMEIDVRILAGEIQPEENGFWLEEAEALAKERLAEQERNERDELFAYAVGIIETVDTYVPLGWLPLGVVRADQRNWMPGIVGSLALFAIGMVSLLFSYRSSMQKYLGVEPRRRRRKKTDQVATKKDEFLFKKLPFASDQVSAVAVFSFRSLMRAPESKMVLIFPLIMGLLAGSFLLGKRDFVVPMLARPWIPLGVIAVTMFGIAQLLLNQFGVDRDGFRAFVLSPIERKDILIGKNVALAPLAVGICLLLICVVQVIVPQGIASFLASVLQVLAVYLLYCVLGNLVSIFFPMGIKRSSMQPANPRFVPMLIMMVGLLVGPTVLMIPTVIACGIPAIIEAVTDRSMGWLYLILSSIQLGLVLAIYRLAIKQQENWLWRQEPRILDVVANIPE